MKASPRLRILCSLGIALALAPSLFSQAVAPANEPAPPPAKPIPVAEEDIVELSPFTVSAEKERGYMASETLAGMRLRTNLKDVGAAIDVLTDQFLNDVGAIDASDALKYVANMQYADYSSTDSNNDAQWHQFAYYSRGVRGSTLLLDFFNTGMVPIDRYNSENLTFMRGTNAILFGIGSPSGIIGSSSKRARMASNQRSVSFMLDQNGSARSEIDISQVLMKNRLALRVAGVLSDKKAFQEPSLNRRNAIYGTLTYRPSRNTSITVLGEMGVYDRLHVLNNLVADAYTPWVNAGRPMVNFVTGDGMTTAWRSDFNAPTSSSYYANRNAYSKTVGNGMGTLSSITYPYLVYIEGAGLPIMDWRAMPRGATHENDVSAGSIDAGTWAPGIMLDSDRSQMSGMPFTRDNTIIDQYANIWGKLNTNKLDYERQSVFFEQKITRSFDIEIAANHFKQEYFFNRFGGSNTILVDTSEVLPDGRLNPYAGMPFIETSSSLSSQKIHARREMIDFRITFSYELNLDHHKIFRGLGVGNYRFGGLFQDSREESQNEALQYVNSTPLPGLPPSFRDNSNHIRRRYYLNPGENTYRFDGNMNIYQASVPGLPTAAQGGSPAPIAQNGPVTAEYRAAADVNSYNNRRHTRSLVLAVQGAWWYSSEGWPRLTGLYGIRQDRQIDQNQLFLRDPVTFEYQHPWDDFDNLAYYAEWEPKVSATVNTKSWNLTFRPFSIIRVFYNYSDILLPSAGGSDYDVYKKSMRSALGETKDYGVKFELFRGRVFIALTKFETSITDGKDSNVNTMRTPINQIYESVPELAHLKIDSPKTYRDDTTTGYELSVNATPARGWNIRIAAGSQKSIVTKLYEDWVAYYDEYRPLWSTYKDRTLVTPGSGYTRVEHAIARADQRLRDSIAMIGMQPIDQRRYNVSFNTGYTIQSGLFKAVRIGLGCRWQSENALGWARDFEGKLDRSKPFKGEDVLTTNASIGYSRKLFKNKLVWDIQINFYNLLNEDDFVARRAVDDGNGNPVVTSRYPVEPFGAQLTNSFKF